MKAQLTLTPAEGKRLIAKAVASMDHVKHALEHGTIIIATSTTTGYVVEELLGKKVDKGMFTAGVVTKEGCGITVTDGRYNHYVLFNGEVTECNTSELIPYLSKMGPDDVFIKGANAIDLFGQAGILLHGSGGGTIGASWGHIVRNGIQCIITAGLEKLVPINLSEAMLKMGANTIEKSMGWPCGMIVIHGQIVTEMEAFDQLFGVEAIPVAGGGIDGGEGCRVFLLDGPNEEVEAAYKLAQEIKGEPQLKTSLTKRTPS